MDIEVSQINDEADEDDLGFKLPNMRALVNTSDENFVSAAQSSVGAMVGWITIGHTESKSMSFHYILKNL